MDYAGTHWEELPRKSPFSQCSENHLQGTVERAVQYSDENGDGRSESSSSDKRRVSMGVSMGGCPSEGPSRV